MSNTLNIPWRNEFRCEHFGFGFGLEQNENGCKPNLFSVHIVQIRTKFAVLPGKFRSISYICHSFASNSLQERSYTCYSLVQYLHKKQRGEKGNSQHDTDDLFVVSSFFNLLQFICSWYAILCMQKIYGKILYVSIKWLNQNVITY